MGLSLGISSADPAWSGNDPLFGNDAQDVWDSFRGKTARRERAANLRRQQRLQDIRAQRERVRIVRTARIAAAESAVTAQAQGAGGSSSAATAQSGITAQAAGNISFLNQVQDLNQQITQGNIDIARADSEQARKQQALELFMKVYGTGG